MLWVVWPALLIIVNTRATYCEVWDSAKWLAKNEMFETCFSGKVKNTTALRSSKC